MRRSSRSFIPLGLALLCVNAAVAAAQAPCGDGFTRQHEEECEDLGGYPCHCWFEWPESYDRGEDGHFVGPGFDCPFFGGGEFFSEHDTCPPSLASNVDIHEFLMAVEQAIAQRDHLALTRLVAANGGAWFEFNRDRSAIQVFTPCTSNPDGIIIAHIPVSRDPASAHYWTRATASTRMRAWAALLTLAVRGGG